MQKKNNNTRNLLIGCGVALLLGVVVSGIGFVVIGNAAVKVFNSLASGPYEIAKRPLPVDGAQDTLLPATVGAYTRGTVTAAGPAFSATYTARGTVDAAGPAFSATYTNGTNTVTAVAIALTSGYNATEAITAIASADTSLSFQSTGTDPSYATDNASQGSATKIYYSRSQYEFNFIGSSPSAYDTFMTKFPY